MSDLATAYAAVKAKRPEYTTLFDYYHGQQPVSYLHKRVKAIFRGFEQNFTANWCSVVVDSVLDKIELLGMTGPDVEEDEFGATPDEEPAWQAPVRELWDANQLQIEAKLAHEAASICGEAALIVQPSDDGGPAEIYFNDPRMVHVEYMKPKPRQVAWAAKFWEDDGETYATLYYADQIEYYAAPKPWAELYSTDSFKPIEEPARHDWGQVPVFHLRTHGRGAYSDLEGVLPLQNALNKLLADMMVAAEFGAFRQRFIISNSTILGNLKNAPNEIWDLGAGVAGEQPTQVGELSAADLTNYLGAIEHLVNEIGGTSRTPRHYFLHQQGGAPSGEALAREEAPLNAKADSRIQLFTPVWRDCVRFALRLSGHNEAASVVGPLWAPVGALTPSSEAAIVKAYTDAGMPLASALRRVGVDEAEIARILEDAAAEAQARRDSLGELYAQAQAEITQAGAFGE